MTEDNDMKQRGIYLELAKINASNHAIRKQYEWKILLGLWVGLALVIWFLLDSKPVLLFNSKVSISIFYGFLLWSVIRCWIMPNQVAFKTDREFQHYYSKLATGKHAPDPNVPESHLPQWAWGQIIVTAGLIIITIIILCSGNSRENPVKEKNLKGGMTMETAIRKIVGEIPEGRVFDSHFVIDQIIKEYSNTYIRFAAQYAEGGKPTEVTHSNIANCIKALTGELVEKLPDDSHSLNIHGKASECALWKRR